MAETVGEEGERGERGLVESLIVRGERGGLVESLIVRGERGGLGLVESLILRFMKLD
jgi:hypothetical protein